MYEIEQRELTARIYLSQRLLNELHKRVCVIIFQHTELWKLSMFSKPGIVFLKSCPDSIVPYLKLMKIRGFIIILLQEEGLHYTKHQETALEFSPKCYKFLDYYLAWHKNDASFAEKMSVSKNKIIVIGNVRFELIINISQKKKFEFQSPKILIVENFSTVNLYKLFKPKHKSNSNLQPEVSALQKIQKSLTNISYNMDIYNVFIKKLICENIDFRIRQYTYGEHDYFAGEFNKYLDTSSSLLEAISDRNIIIHYGSTAGVESILGKCISVIFTDPKSEILDKNILGCSLNFKSVDSLMDFLRNLNSEAFNSLHKLQLDKLSFIYGHHLISPDSTDKIIKVIESNLNIIKIKFKISPYYIYIVFYSLKLWISKIRFKIKYYFNFKYGVSKSSKTARKSELFTVSKIEAASKLLNFDTSDFNFKISPSKKLITISK